jgi:hypothetical protein
MKPVGTKYGWHGFMYPNGRLAALDFDRHLKDMKKMHSSLGPLAKLLDLYVRWAEESFESESTTFRKFMVEAGLPMKVEKDKLTLTLQRDPDLLLKTQPPEKDKKRSMPRPTPMGANREARRVA